MRYILLIYRDEKAYELLGEAERAALFEDSTAYGDAHRPTGLYQGGEPLELVHTATTVRMKSGKPLITDGPFAETKEQVAGYMVLEAKDLDQALDFASRHPLVKAGLTIEVRPVRVWRAQ